MHFVPRLLPPGSPTTPGTGRLQGSSLVPVLDDDRRVQGTLTIPDLVRAYRDDLRANLRPSGQSAAGTATFGIDALPDSPFMGRHLRDAELPAGDVATAIQRNGDVLTPTGDTVIRVGDRLSLLGRPTDINDASRRPAERMSAPDDGP